MPGVCCRVPELPCPAISGLPFSDMRLSLRSFPMLLPQPSHGGVWLVTGRGLKLEISSPEASEPDSEVASGTLMEMFTLFQRGLTLPWAPAGTN